MQECRAPSRSCRAEWVALFLLIAIKLILLAVFGPTSEPDWGGYSHFADLILNETGWRTDAGLATTAAPLTLFRPIGYPLVVAVFREALGNGPLHLYAIVLFQIALSLAATVAAWRLALTLLRDRWLAMLVAAGHAFTLALLYDQSTLSDSIFNSLFVLCWAIPLEGALAKRPLKVWVLAGLGGLYGVACLQRGVGTLFFPLILMPVAVWVWKATSLRRLRMVPAACAFLVPLVAIVGGNMAWNHARTGHWVMTTGAQCVMIQPMVKAAGRGHQVFDGETPIDQLARRYLRTYEYDELSPIVEGLFTDYGINAIESAELHKQVFVRAWLHRPLAMAQNTALNFNNSLFFQLFDPVDTALTYSRLVTGRRLFSGFGQAWREVLNGNLGAVLVLVLIILARTVAYASLALLLAGSVTLMRRVIAGKASTEEVFVLGLAALFFAYTLALCAIHMVARFLPAVTPAALVTVVFAARMCQSWLVTRRKRAMA